MYIVRFVPKICILKYMIKKEHVNQEFLSKRMIKKQVVFLEGMFSSDCN